VRDYYGLPSELRAGIEGLSGLSMGDVSVHYQSSKPAQLHAAAFAQGSEIHLGPGQERHLPHEAWHVVQQKQGRVAANTQFAGAPISHDPGLEREADEMGSRALQTRGGSVVEAAAGAGAVQRVFTRAHLEDYSNRMLEEIIDDENKYPLEDRLTAIQVMVSRDGEAMQLLLAQFGSEQRMWQADPHNVLSVLRIARERARPQPPKKPAPASWWGSWLGGANKEEKEPETRRLESPEPEKRPLPTSPEPETRRLESPAPQKRPARPDPREQKPLSTEERVAIEKDVESFVAQGVAAYLAKQQREHQRQFPGRSWELSGERRQAVTWRCHCQSRDAVCEETKIIAAAAGRDLSLYSPWRDALEANIYELPTVFG
jgi:hypothetical protein